MQPATAAVGTGTTVVRDDVTTSAYRALNLYSEDVYAAGDQIKVGAFSSVASSVSVAVTPCWITARRL